MSVRLTVVHPGPEFVPQGLKDVLPSSVTWVSYRRRKPSIQIIVRSILRLAPVFYSLAYSPELAKWLRKLPRNAFDAVHLDGLPAFNYWREATSISENVVVDLRDSWSLLYRRIYETSGRRFVQLIKSYLVGRIERQIVNDACKLVMISDADVRYVEKLYPNVSRNIDIIPNGVASEFFKVTARPISCTNPTIAFTGAMNYKPNAQAVIFFCREVLPVLKQRHPGIRFVVIGKNPSPELLKLASDSVIVTGEVMSVAIELTHVDIVVAPLLSGAGMKNKVLEALAATRPLVASKVAVEGIDLQHGKHYLLADSVDQWVKSINALISRPMWAADIAAKGREKVLEKYSWHLVGKKFIYLYDRECNNWKR